MPAASFLLFRWECTSSWVCNILWHRSPPVTVGWLAQRGVKMTASGIPNRLNCCAVFTVYTQFTSMAAGRIVQPGGRRVGDMCAGAMRRYIRDVKLEPRHAYATVQLKVRSRSGIWVEYSHRTLLRH